MAEFSFLNSCKNNEIQSSSLLSHLFNIFFFIFLSPYLLRLLSFFSPLFITTISLLALSPPNSVHANDGSETCDSKSKVGFLLSLVESLVQKLSSRNDENSEEIRSFVEFQAYLDVFRPPIFEILEENCSESGYSGDEGRESRAHMGSTEKEPNFAFDGNPFEQDDGKVEAAKPIAEENTFSGKECREVLEENYSSESGYSADDGRESKGHVGPMVKQPNVRNSDENPSEKEDNDDKVEAARPITEENMLFQKECREVLEENYSESERSGDEGRDHVDLMEDPKVNLGENPVGEEDDDVDKVGKNTKLQDMFCQKRDKEVKPLDTNSNKAEESKGKMALRNGSKVMCNYNNSRIDATDSAANSEEYFATPERVWDYNRSYGSMRRDKEWRRTLACKLYEERNNVDDGSEAMDLLWETYEDTEPDKAKGKTNSEEEEEDEEEEEEEEEEKGKGIESKYCCLRALKFSSGKMNLGMTRPSLVKFSKALKRIGLLHHVSKHGRKKLH